ncbi:MAG: hypothetical protein LBC82_05185 [Oscillospiraceae bacterium]|jgi:hypothetical protein|nr:hypothetical protein [Oscillospiraceae bacterium]
MFDDLHFIYPEKPVFNGSFDGIPDDLGVEAESDYSNIVAVTEFNEYDSTVDEIKFFVINNNPNKGFWVSTIIQLERLENNEWVQLQFAEPPTSIDFMQWGFAFAKTSDGLVEHEWKLVTSYLAEDLIPGNYRIIVFTGGIDLYAIFKIM